MSVDPQIQRLLDARAKLPAIETLTITDARALMAARDIPGMRKPAVAIVAERVIDGPGGGLTLRIYTPPGVGPFPLMTFFHGGGFVLCSLDTHDGLCRNLCVGAGCVVVSVDYRLAPEHKFPAGIDDCLAATRWTVDYADALHGDAQRLMVAGDSAGGNFAAVTALRVRDEGGPTLCGQMLIYPVTDHYSADTASMRENAAGYGLTRAAMGYYWDHYLNNAGEARHPLAAPLRASSLAGLPPTLLVTAQYDPLRDEGEHYGAALVRAGVTVTMKRWLDVNHGFFFFPGVVDSATAAVDEASAWARAVFARCRRQTPIANGILASTPATASRSD